MFAMNDIQPKVDQYIVSRGFYQMETKDQKELIYEGLKKYINAKIREVSGFKYALPEARLPETTPQELAHILADIIPTEAHDHSISHLTHYVLGMATYYQMYAVIWHVEERPELLESPEMTYTEDGKWDKLTTSKQTPYVKTFECALQELNKVMEKSDKDNKVFRKKTETRN